MNQNNNTKKNRGGVLIFIILVAVICAAGVFLFQKFSSKKETDQTEYQKEIVRRGTISTGIKESGTIEFGTLEQTFEVAEISEVSDSDSSSDSSSASGSASGTGSFSAQAGGQNNGSFSMGMMTGGTSASGSGGQQNSSSSSSSGETTILVVEEVSAAPGQVVKVGDRILKITEDSIAEYRTELENAVSSAKLLVSKEEINVETKKAEADYNYKMYLANGETAKETYDATIKSLEEKITDLEEEIEEEDDEDELEALQAELDLAKNNLTTGSIEAKQTYDNAMTNYKYADQLYAIDTNGLEDDLNDAKDTLAECEQNLKDFEEQIGDGSIYAEYAGTVESVSYEKGDYLVNGATVAICTDPDNVIMTVSVSQDDIAKVEVGKSAKVTLDAYEGETFDAEITEISTTAKTGSSTVNYDVTVRLTGDTSKVYPGMTGEVSIDEKTVADTLYVSNKAIRLNGADSVVKVLEDDGSIREVSVATGFSDGKYVAVESGLEEGQIVLLESQVNE